MNWDLSLLNHIDDFLHSHGHVSKKSNAYKLQRVTDKVGNRHILDENSIAMLFDKIFHLSGRKKGLIQLSSER